MANILLFVISIGTIARAAVAAPLDDFTEDTFAQLLVDGRPVLDLESRAESLASMEDLEAFRSQLRDLESIDSLSEPIHKLSSVNGYNAPLLEHIGKELSERFQKRFMCNTNPYSAGCGRKRLQSRSGYNLNRSGVNTGSSAQRQVDTNYQPVGFRTLLKRFMCNVGGCRNRFQRSTKYQGPKRVVSGEQESTFSQQNSEEVIDAPPKPVEMYPYNFKQYVHGYDAENLVDRSNPRISRMPTGLCGAHPPTECTLNPG